MESGARDRKGYVFMNDGSGGEKNCLNILVLLGPPGGGKGTQAKKIVEEFGYAHFSTGDALREEVQNETEIGKQAKSIMDSGDLVPDELLGAMVRDRIDKAAGSEGIILDGYPRTVAQAEFLSTFTGDMNVAAVNIRVDQNQIIERLSGRRFCPNCGTIYNISFSPPAKEGICDKCGTGLARRKDDYEDVIRERLRVYDEKTQPVVDYYEDSGSYFEVDGNRSPEEVFIEVSKIVRSV